MTPPAAVRYGVSLGDTSDGILDILWEFYHTPKPRVIILRTERSLKCSKRRLACAVTQCHAINFPFVMQGCHNPRNLRLWSCDQVKAPNRSEEHTSELQS